MSLQNEQVGNRRDAENAEKRREIQMWTTAVQFRIHTQLTIMALLH